MDVFGTLEVRFAQGLTSPKVEFIDDKTACYVCGSFIVFLDIATKKRHMLQSPGRGIDVFAANSLTKTLTFSERGLNPSIYVYSYPELVLRSDLKGSAKLEYTTLALSRSGPYLACVSGIPEHTLTIWNWETQTIICAEPKVGKEVIHLMFHPTNWRQICASYTSSITVWNIESCGKINIMTTSVIDLPAADGSVLAMKARPPQNYTYYGPLMPIAAIAGLKAERADGFVPRAQRTERFFPSSLCWTASSDLYVGCREGHLLLVNVDSLSVSILLTPQQHAAQTETEKGTLLQEGSMQSIALHRDGLFAAGNDGILRCVQIEDKSAEITQFWDVGEPVANTVISPDVQSLLLSSSQGSIFSFQTVEPQKMEKVLDPLVGNFVAAAQLYSEKNLCVSVRDSGVLQLWSVDDETCISSISLQAKVVSLACCPIAQLVAVGTETGHVLFIDLTTERNPRIVHRIYLHHVPVSQLTYDHGGNFLIAVASDSKIFVLDARPSRRFEVIGFTETAGAVAGLSTLWNWGDSEVKALALCAAERGARPGETTRLLSLSLPVQQLTGATSCTDPSGRLPDELLQKRHYEVPHPLTSAALGPDNKVFGHCHWTNTLQCFQIPQNLDLQKNDVVQLKPVQEGEGHPLGPVSLLLSPHQLWLASAGRDGLVRIRDASCPEKYLQMQCHACWQGGAKTLSFSADGQTLITTGREDGSMVCVRLRLETDDSEKAAEAAKCGQAMLTALKSLQSLENPIVSELPEWNLNIPSRPGSSLQKEKEAQARCKVDVTEDNESDVPPPDLTWLDSKHAEALRQESEQYAEAKDKLMKDFRRIQEVVQSMMRENEELPEMERLEFNEFNVDVDAKQRLQAKEEEEVAKVRREAELQNLAMSNMFEVIKRECWDSMEVKGRAIKAFHSDQEVNNYPMKAETHTLEDKEMLQIRRRVESQDRQLKRDVVEASDDLSTTDDSSTGEDEELETDDRERKGKGKERRRHRESPALTGSLSALFTDANPNLHSQLNLHYSEEKIEQITMLQDTINRVKTAFNQEFEAVWKQKEQEINQVKEKNRRIREILEELEIDRTLWEPTLTDSERPELIFTVTESEIKVEKYLSAEGRQKEEELKKAEERRRQAGKVDDYQERALMDMMQGVLEMKTESILKVTIAEPEYMSRPEDDWTEEEKMSHKEYEKEVKELKEEQEKHRKILWHEMKQLEKAIQESTHHFDEVLTKFFKKKVSCEMVIYQEELKIANLAQSLATEEEIHCAEEQLQHKLREAKAFEAKMAENIQKYQRIVDGFQKAYDRAVAADKLLDQSFLKRFQDVPAPMVDQLYKLYKRRPRVEEISEQTDKGTSQLMEALEDFDQPENKPKDLDLTVWQRFCKARRTKVEREQRVIQKALELADVQAFLQRRVGEEKSAKARRKKLISELTSLHKKKIEFEENVMVQILVKQGQVEVDMGRFIADYSECELIHRSNVEELNRRIRAISDQKIAHMVEIKDFRKGVIQLEWECKRMTMMLEDLNNKIKDIQMLNVTREQQEYLNTTDHDKNVSKQISDLEKRLELLGKTSRKDVTRISDALEDLRRRAARKSAANAQLEQQLADLTMGMAEKRQIRDTSALQRQRERASRDKEIMERKRLEIHGNDQIKKIAALRAELGKLRRKNFPEFPDAR